jgi:hypothetical protein
LSLVTVLWSLGSEACSVMDWWILTMVWTIAYRTRVCAAIYSNILHSHDEVARGMLMFPSLSLSSWFMLELSIWLGMCDRIRRDRLKSRKKEWEEQRGRRCKRRIQLSNWCHCRCKIHNTPTLTAKKRINQGHKTKHHHASTQLHQTRHG